MTTVSRPKMLAFAALLAGMTTFLAYRVLFTQAQAQTRLTTTAAPSGAAQIVVAERDIQPLERLDQDMFRVVKPSGEAAKGSVTSLAQVENRLSARFIAKGESVNSADLVFPDPKYGMAFQVPVGSRAMTVPVNSVSGLAGFLKPGNRVDVLATFDTQNNDAVTKTVVQDVIILAYGEHLQPDRKESASDKKDDKQAQPADTATLLVSPRQCEPLALAASKAKLSLALRSVREEAPVTPMTGAIEHQLTGIGGAARPQPRPERSAIASQPNPAPIVTPAVHSDLPQPAVRQIIVLRGTRQEIVTVPR